MSVFKKRRLSENVVDQMHMMQVESAQRNVLIDPIYHQKRFLENVLKQFRNAKPAFQFTNIKNKFFCHGFCGDVDSRDDELLICVICIEAKEDFLNTKMYFFPRDVHFDAEAEYRGHGLRLSDDYFDSMSFVDIQNLENAYHAWLERRSLFERMMVDIRNHYQELTYRLDVESNYRIFFHDEFLVSIPSSEDFSLEKVPNLIYGKVHDRINSDLVLQTLESFRGHFRYHWQIHRHDSELWDFYCSFFIDNKLAFRVFYKFSDGVIHHMFILTFDEESYPEPFGQDIEGGTLEAYREALQNVLRLKVYRV